MSVREIIHNKEKLFGLLFTGALAVAPLIALLAPRFLAYWPGILGLVSLGLFPAVFGRWPAVPKAALLWIGGFLVLAGLSSLWAIDGGYAISRTFKVALILLPGAVLLAVAGSVPLTAVRPFLPLCLIAAAAAAVLCGLEILLGFPSQRLLHGLMSINLVAPANLNRSIVAITCFLFIAAGIAPSLYSRSVTIGLFIVALPMMAMTQSQSAQLGFIMAFICFMLFPYGHKKAWYGLAGALCLGVMAAPFIAMSLFDHFAANVEQMPFFGRGSGFGSERLEIWDKIARYAMQNPLYGYGIDATRMIKDFDTAQIYRQGVTELHPHNFAIQLWIEFGVIGALYCAGFFAYLFRGLSRVNFRQARIALPVFMVLLSAMAFGYGLWQSWFLGLIIFTIAFTALAMRLYGEQES